MSQDWNTDVYDKDARSADAIMQDVEKMLDTLQSSFSGGSAPSSPVAGMWWFDTTANLLKLRNEANNAWLSVWDLANNKPIITNLSDEITVAMIAASAKDPAAGTAGLRTIGTGAVQAAAGNDSRFGVADDNSVTMEKMQHGSIMLPFVEGSGNTVSPAWFTVHTCGGKVYIPANATSVTMSCELRSDNASGIAYGRFDIGGLNSSSVTVSGVTWTWRDTATSDVSSLDGWYALSLEAYTNNVSYTAYIRNSSFIWE